jgi:hypothetical protein
MCTACVYASRYLDVQTPLNNVCVTLCMLGGKKSNCHCHTFRLWCYNKIHQADYFFVWNDEKLL